MNPKSPLTLLRDVLTEIAVIDLAWKQRDLASVALDALDALTADASDPARDMVVAKTPELALKAAETRMDAHFHGGGEYARPAPVVATPAVEDDRQYERGYRMAMLKACEGLRDLHVNHVFHTGINGMMERCKQLEQAYQEKADGLAKAIWSAAPAAPAPMMTEDARQLWDDAMSHAAFYVRDHCVDGEHHAETIVSMLRPDFSAPAAPTARKFRMTPALRKAVTEWGCATNGCEDADDNLLEVLNAMAPAAPIAPPLTPKHIEEIKDILLWPVTEDDARTARDMLQSLHFDLSMIEPAAPIEEGRAKHEFNEAEFDAMVDKGTKVWSAVPDGWLEDHRGNTPEQAKPEPVERDLFEAWARKQASGHSLAYNGRGNYADYATECAWAGWHGRGQQSGAVDADKGGE